MTNYHQKIEENKEKLADIEHERWSDWQRYCHSKLSYVEYEHDGKTNAGYLMDAGDYTRWERQIDTPYSDLSEQEKQSDRDQVDRYWHLIKDLLDEAVRKERRRIEEAYDDYNAGNIDLADFEETLTENK